MAAILTRALAAPTKLRKLYIGSMAEGEVAEELLAAAARRVIPSIVLAWERGPTDRR